MGFGQIAQQNQNFFTTLGSLALRQSNANRAIRMELLIESMGRLREERAGKKKRAEEDEESQRQLNKEIAFILMDLIAPGSGRVAKSAFSKSKKEDDEEENGGLDFSKILELFKNKKENGGLDFSSLFKNKGGASGFRFGF